MKTDFNNRIINAQIKKYIYFIYEQSFSIVYDSYPRFYEFMLNTVKCKFINFLFVQTRKVIFFSNKTQFNYNKKTHGIFIFNKQFIYTKLHNMQFIYIYWQMT